MPVYPGGRTGGAFAAEKWKTFEGCTLSDLRGRADRISAAVRRRPHTGDYDLDEVMYLHKYDDRREEVTWLEYEPRLA